MNSRWLDFFVQVARAAQGMSRDPSTQVGAVVFDSDRQIVSTGFNGVPRGVRDGDAPSRAYRRRTERPEKYLFMEHAERNAIFQGARRGIALQGCEMVVTHPPCASCMRAIIQSGIHRVWILDGEILGSDWSKEQEAAEEMAREAQVVLVRPKVTPF